MHKWHICWKEGTRPALNWRDDFGSKHFSHYIPFWEERETTLSNTLFSLPLSRSSFSLPSFFLFPLLSLLIHFFSFILLLHQVYTTIHIHIRMIMFFPFTYMFLLMSIMHWTALSFWWTCWCRYWLRFWFPLRWWIISDSSVIFGSQIWPTQMPNCLRLIITSFYLLFTFITYFSCT